MLAWIAPKCADFHTSIGTRSRTLALYGELGESIVSVRAIQVCVVGFCFAGPLSAAAEPVHPEKSGEALLVALDAEYSPRRTLSYRAARTKMFGDIDNRNGQVTLVYTGQSFRTRSIPNANIVNTEHTWPQSKFKRSQRDRKAGMKADLHHLFPTFSKVNSVRGSNPFADIPDRTTTRWWNSSNERRLIPNDALDTYSESTNSRFEPRESHKGNVARAMAYFFTVFREHNINVEWFRPQIETLFAWHKADPVDDAERARSHAIASLQGNENPYVLDPTLFGRALMGEAGTTVDDGEVEPDELKAEMLERIEALTKQLDALKRLVEEME